MRWEGGLYGFPLHITFEIFKYSSLNSLGSQKSNIMINNFKIWFLLA